jgi:glycosyltransferase involved in cell wall biosynthesis
MNTIKNINKLLVIDTSYSFEAITSRTLHKSVLCRDLNGYFNHVWTVHPFASLVTSSEWSDKYGELTSYNVNGSHTFIEGKIGRYKLLEKFPRINFILSQIYIIIYIVILIKRQNISVIRAGDPLYTGFLGYILSKLTGIPFIVRVGANNEKIRQATNNRIMPRLFKKMSQERWMEKFVLTRADLIAGANYDNLQFAINSGAPLAKTTVFRYGNLIDESHFTDPKTRSLPLGFDFNMPFLLCIARLELVKKVDDVIRVLKIVRDNGFNVRILIVGEGRERKKLEEIAINLNVYEMVIFCGNRDQNWISSVIPFAEVVLSPHTGRALTEAALGGAPICAYDVDWQSELIESGISGELVPFKDYNQMAKKAIKLIQDREYARRIGGGARVRALEMMNPEKLNDHEIRFYEDLISPRRLL